MPRWCHPRGPCQPLLSTTERLWNLFTEGEGEAVGAMGPGRGWVEERTKPGAEFPFLFHTRERGLQAPRAEALTCHMKEAPERIEAGVGWGGVV